MKRTLGNFFPGVLLIALLSIFTSTTVYASVTAKASNSTAQSITSVKFKIAPETTTGGTASGIITLTGVGANSDNYMYYVNTGTVNDTAFSWTVVHTVGFGGYTLNYCPVNTTFSTATRCSDASTPVVMALTGTGPALTIGQWRPVHIKINTSGNAFTFASTVSGSQIRAGTNTVA